MASVPAYVTVSPQGLTFPVRDVSQRQPLTINNLTDEDIIYKIKTTAPQRYLVRPTQGFLRAKEEVRCVVMLRAPEASEGMNSARHRFLIQAMPAPRDTAALDDLGAYWKQQEQLSTPHQQLRIISMLIVPEGDTPVPNTENVSIAVEAGPSATVADDIDSGVAVAESSIASKENVPAAAKRDVVEGVPSSQIRVSISSATQAAEAAASDAASEVLGIDSLTGKTSPLSTSASSSAQAMDSARSGDAGDDSKNAQSFEVKYRGMLAYSLVQVQKVKTLESKLDAVQTEAERLRAEEESLRKKVSSLTNLLDSARNSNATESKDSTMRKESQSLQANAALTGMKREFVLAVWQLLLILAVGLFFGRAFSRSKCGPLDK